MRLLDCFSPFLRLKVSNEIKNGKELPSGTWDNELEHNFPHDSDEREGNQNSDSRPYGSDIKSTASSTLSLIDNGGRLIIEERTNEIAPSVPIQESSRTERRGMRLAGRFHFWRRCRGRVWDALYCRVWDRYWRNWIWSGLNVVGLKLLILCSLNYNLHK
uniref:Uncharacterized protein n=1 Tax=Solanum tuberosum TaxID=4113 RepID=M1E0D7_SOLTU